MTSVDVAIAPLLRELAPQVLGALARRSGDFVGAEDAVRALAHYHAAAERTTSIPERDYLTTRAARLAAALT